MELLVIFIVVVFVGGICYLIGQKFDERFGGFDSDDAEEWCEEAADEECAEGCSCKEDLQPEQEEKQPDTAE